MATKATEATIRSDKPKDITVRDGVVLFWGGPFSQWYPEYNEKWVVPSSFTIDGHRYDRAEKWMMAEKARLFGDEVQLAKILASSSPVDVKAYGRLVKGYDDARWKRASRRVVFEGNLAKFGQSAKLRELLLSTGNLRIAEASPEDDLWGIGLAASDPRASDPRKWKGSNWLGKALEKVRAALRAPAPRAPAPRAVAPRAVAPRRGGR